MASEIVMYLSMVALGMLIFGSMSLVLGGIQSGVEEDAIDVTLEVIVSDVAKAATSMVNQAKEQIQAGATSVTITVQLELPDSIEGAAYQLTVETTSLGGVNHWVFKATVQGYNIEVSKVTSLTSSDVTISGTLLSGAIRPSLTYTYSSSTSFPATLTLSNS